MRLVTDPETREKIRQVVTLDLNRYTRYSLLCDQTQWLSNLLISIDLRR